MFLGGECWWHEQAQGARGQSAVVARNPHPSRELTFLPDLVEWLMTVISVLGHNGCLLPAKPLHQMCTQLLDFSYLTRDPIYDTLLRVAIENPEPSRLQV